MKELKAFNQRYLEKTTVSFKQLELIDQALTHDSCGDIGKTFERMEFLGDACLEMAIAHLLVTQTDFSEGQMSQLRSQLTSRGSLADITRSWNIEPWIKISKAMDIQQLPNTVYADFFESLLGALFLDRGHQAVHQVVEHVFAERIRSAKASDGNFASPKTKLQNWTMAQKIPLPVYSTLSKKGPAHAPKYTVQVEVAEQRFSIVDGSIKKAEFKVAEIALAELAQKS